MSDETPDPPKRKPGRPRRILPPATESRPGTAESKNGSAACDGSEEALAGSGGAGALQPLKPGNRRGRPKGVKNKVKDKVTAYYDNKWRSTARTVAEWMALRSLHPNLSNKEIAATIGITTEALYKSLQRARKDGTLDLSQPMEQLRYNIIPKAVDNLGELLDKKDKTATLETMKGTLFPAYRAAEGASEMPNMVLAIKVEMPDGVDTSQMKQVAGSIVGKPRELKPATEIIDIETQS